MSIERLTQHLGSGGLVVLDGGCGTELGARGHDIGEPLWSAGALVTPAGQEAVAAIYADYVRAGAEIITTNTFRTQPRTFAKIEWSGHVVTPEQRARAATLAACRLARRAVDAEASPPWVAGSIAPLEDCYEPTLTPPQVELDREHSDQAELLGRGGVDLIVAETMPTVREAKAALQAARAAGLPAAVSFCTNTEGQVLSGESLREAVRAVEPLDPLFIGVNCVTPRAATTAVRALTRLTELPVAAYAQGSGHPGPGNKDWQWEADPDHHQRYIKAARGWIDLGAQAIGGCCGTSPAYVRDLRTLVNGLYSTATAL